MEKFFDILGEVIAFILVVLFAVLIINANFNFIPEGVMKVLLPIKEWGGLILIAVVGLEAIANKNIVIKILFLLCLAVCVIFMFFPGTYDYLIKLVKK